MAHIGTTLESDSIWLVHFGSKLSLTFSCQRESDLLYDSHLPLPPPPHPCRNLTYKMNPTKNNFDVPINFSSAKSKSVIIVPRGFHRFRLRDLLCSNTLIKLLVSSKVHLYHLYNFKGIVLNGFQTDLCIDCIERTKSVFLYFVRNLKSDLSSVQRRVIYVARRLASKGQFHQA